METALPSDTGTLPFASRTFHSSLSGLLLFLEEHMGLFETFSVTLKCRTHLSIYIYLPINIFSRILINFNFFGIPWEVFED